MAVSFYMGAQLWTLSRTATQEHHRLEFKNYHFIINFKYRTDNKPNSSDYQSFTPNK